ncbi:MAG: thiamine pyrophosphate-dependent enzyme, partial [Caulobacterales bacterium]|nr:thiamine pyrophosphate-dependent enzyme [Caulobacterales bacterium]
MSDEHSRSDLNEALLETAFLYGGNAQYVEEMQARYAADPSSVDPTWRAFFDRMGDSGALARQAAEGPSWARSDWPPAPTGEYVHALDGDWPADLVAPELAGKIAAHAPTDVRQETQDSIRALMMIRAYRIRGHLAADLDPLKLAGFGPQPELDPGSYGFGPGDLDRPIFIDGVLGLDTATVRQMLGILKRTYCSTLGVEFMHISNPEEKGWLQQRIEGPDKGVSFTREGKIAILRKLIETESFELFLHKRYPGTKRFGIDGGEAMVPALEQIIKRGGALGVDDIVLGMPHRGRLNVLAAVMGKPYHAIFHEFQGGATWGAEQYGSGDVKYHLGASSDREFDGNAVHLSLTANPSHLEAVNPVVLGKARAKQFQAGVMKEDDSGIDRRHVLPLLLHGDASFAGQGVVA